MVSSCMDDFATTKKKKKASLLSGKKHTNTNKAKPLQRKEIGF